MPICKFTQKQREAGQVAQRQRRKKFLEESSKLADRFLAYYKGPLPGWVMATLAKVRKGNRKAMIALRCWDCVGFETKQEAANCSIAHCPLWLLRPGA